MGRPKLTHATKRMSEHLSEAMKKPVPIIGWAEVMRRANIPPSRGRRLVEQGLVTPDLVSGANWFFLAESVERIVKEIRKADGLR